MLKAHIGEMASNSSGFFIADVNGTEEVVAYETMPATGWVTVVSVPADFVFAGINKLRMVYSILTVLGIVLIIASLLFFSNIIVKQIMGLVELCKKLIFRKKEIQMPLNIILDVLYLYIRLKRSKTLIPTTSVGYNKKQVSRPVQIDTAMNNIREEWGSPDGKSVPDELYMKNIMVETWLSGVLYMFFYNMDVHLFNKMLTASEKLFLALTQLLPSISIKRKRSAIETRDEFQTPEDFLNNIYDYVNDSLWDQVVDEQPDEDDLLVDKILTELLWD